MSGRNPEIENRAYVHDAIAVKQSRRNEYELAVKAEMVAWIMRAYCPEGQDVPCEALKKLYLNLRGVVQ